MGKKTVSWSFLRDLFLLLSPKFGVFYCLLLLSAPCPFLLPLMSSQPEFVDVTNRWKILFDETTATWAPAELLKIVKASMSD